MNNDKITLTYDDGETVEFYVVEQTKLNGISYLLVAESDDDDADCLILKDISDAADKESIFVELDDDVELDAVFHVFEELLEDIDIER